MQYQEMVVGRVWRKEEVERRKEREGGGDREEEEERGEKGKKLEEGGRGGTKDEIVFSMAAQSQSLSPLSRPLFFVP